MASADVESNPGAEYWQKERQRRNSMMMDADIKLSKVNYDEVVNKLDVVYRRGKYRHSYYLFTSSHHKDCSQYICLEKLEQYFYELR